MNCIMLYLDNQYLSFSSEIIQRDLLYYHFEAVSEREIVEQKISTHIQEGDYKSSCLSVYCH